MKKMFFVIVALLCVTQIVKADESKGYQFVKWQTLPQPSKEQVVQWYKNALMGMPIQGAQVRASVSSYTSVYGASLYKKILNSETDDFEFTLSSGGELNYGLNQNGNPVNPKPLAAGVRILKLNGIPIVKWGTNGCLNALRPAQVSLVDDEDLDNQKPSPVSKTEYVYIPGTKKVIEHGPDTLIEKFTNYKEVEKNNFTKVNNQSFTLENTQEVSYGQQNCNHRQQSSVCNHQRSQELSCRCNNEYLCDQHYRQPQKERKKFFNTVGGKVLIFTAGAVTGAVLQNNINLGRRTVNVPQSQQPTRIITQGPLDPLPSTNPVIITQGPFN